MSSKYQVVIPLLVRKLLGLQAGTEVDVIVKGNVAYIVPILPMEALQRKFAGKLNFKGLRDKKDRI
ncbi:MAG: AbrB/MazE/SpoVT family DNA-binding domain-containing protein [Deltaproteobacteria bacterium]|nr:AbrB/MazE/SpoVT family DNA-binding domain-containing protein [Deltaproteobacteria bacterium]